MYNVFFWGFFRSFYQKVHTYILCNMYYYKADNHDAYDGTLPPSTWELTSFQAISCLLSRRRKPLFNRTSATYACK